MNHANTPAKKPSAFARMALHLNKAKCFRFS
jgi:hypothetical protein